MDDDDFNAYTTFVIIAVLGQMASADALLKDPETGERIRRSAKYYRHLLPLPLKKPLWRGLLIEPDGVQEEGGRYYLGPHPDLTFASWSESKRAACWFADRRTHVSELVTQTRPRVRGWLMKQIVPKSHVYWHHTWTRIPMPDGRTLPLKFGARAFARHVGDISQFDWNLDTQREVITAPQQVRRVVQPIEAVDCPDTAALDAEFAWPGRF